jgi:hypothetical protein
MCQSISSTNVCVTVETALSAFRKSTQGSVSLKGATSFQHEFVGCHSCNSHNLAPSSDSQTAMQQLGVRSTEAQDLPTHFRNHKRINDLVFV